MRGRSLNLKVDPLKIKWEGKSPIDGIKAVGDRDYSSAQAWQYRVQSPDNWWLILAYLVFERRRDKRDIRILECSDGTPEYIRRLKRGLRMSVYRYTGRGKDWVELSQAQPTPDSHREEWSTLKRASEEKLNLGSGFCLSSRIEDLGGSFGLHKDILGESERRNNYYCAISPHNDHGIPVLCYIATRVLALIRANELNSILHSSPLPTTSCTQR